MIHTHAVRSERREKKRKKSEEKRVAVAKHKCRFLELNVCVLFHSMRKKNERNNIRGKKCGFQINK